MKNTIKPSSNRNVILSSSTTDVKGLTKGRARLSEKAPSMGLSRRQIICCQLRSGVACVRQMVRGEVQTLTLS